MAIHMLHQPTASQLASAAVHLERRAEWRYVRIDGTRYVVLPSGRSDRAYWVRADGDGCGCLWYQRTGTSCSHMIAVRQANAEDAPPPAPSLKSYRELFPPCAAGCGDLADTGSPFCYACDSAREYAARMASKRQAVTAGRI